MSSSSSTTSWFNVRQELSPSRRKIIGWASFLLPLLIWCAVSYLPFIWHPMVTIEKPGAVDYFQENMLVSKEVFNYELDNVKAAGKELPTGIPSNPVYLPSPDKVAKAFYTGFTTAPVQKDGMWLHQSLWQSMM